MSDNLPEWIKNIEQTLNSQPTWTLEGVESLHAANTIVKNGIQRDRVSRAQLPIHKLLYALKIAIDALEFYAGPDLTKTVKENDRLRDYDHGEIAREALAKIKEGKIE